MQVNYHFVKQRNVYGNVKFYIKKSFGDDMKQQIPKMSQNFMHNI